MALGDISCPLVFVDKKESAYFRRKRGVFGQHFRFDLLLDDFMGFDK